MKQLILLDFDGTITTRDSLFGFLKFHSGKNYYLNMFLLGPHFLMYLFKIISAQKIKEKIIHRFIKENDFTELVKISNSFIEHLTKENIIKAEFIELILKSKNENTTIAVVSASPDLWINSFCEKHALISICTRLEFINGKYTGRFLTPNCNGKEKEIRINKHFDLSQYDKIIAYGNSEGDKEMLALAHESYIIKK